MSKFAFDKSIPAEVRAVAEKYLLPVEWMIPGWCARVRVVWVSEDSEECSMQVVANFEYRFAELTVRPLFLELDEDMRRDSAVHEMIHLHTNPFYDWSLRTLKVLLSENEEHKTLAEEEARRYIEGVTQDLTDTIFRRLNDAKATAPTT